MLKNIRLSFKIGGGYCLLVLITCILGLVGITNMWRVEDKAKLMAHAYVPEVVIINELERNVLLTMYSMRGYSLSDNPVYLKEGQDYLAKVKEGIAKAETLISEQPALIKLRDGLDQLKSNMSTYETLMGKTEQASNGILEARKAMDKEAGLFSAKMDALLGGQQSKLTQEIAFGASESALSERHKKITVYTSIGDTLYQTRILAFKAFAARNSKQFELARANFQGLNDLFEELIPITRVPANVEHLNEARAAAENYRKAVLAVADRIRTLEEVGEQRGATADKVVDATAAIATAGLSQTETIAMEADTSLDVASKIMLWGLGLSIALALGIALPLTRSITAPLSRVVGFAEAVAKGNLNSSLSEQRGDELGKLADAIRTMVGSLKERIEEAAHKSEAADIAAREAQEAMRTAEAAGKKAEAGRASILQAAEQLQQVVEVVTSASEELSAQIDQSSKGADIQTQRAGEAATAMEQMTASVIEVASNAAAAAQSAETTRVKAQAGSGVVQQAVREINQVQQQSTVVKNDMTQLDQQAESIGQIMNVISDIADQTNLLALNAAIEAARAGEAGRGFAVVADEVRKLAEKTMTATKEVGDAIKGIQSGTRQTAENLDLTVKTIGEATRLATESGHSLDEILHLVEDVTSQVQTIATAAEEQSAASEQISHSVEEVNTISAETSQAMNQASEAVAELANQAQRLKDLIDNMLADGR
ncbi:MAG: methyl-accepting chemotaxis protein [Halodesulfovibrio sp.]